MAACSIDCSDKGSGHWPFGDLKPLQYNVVLADPPWYFKNYSEKGEEKNPVAHYDCMELEDIKKLPVGHLMRGDAVCLMKHIIYHIPKDSCLTILSMMGNCLFFLSSSSSIRTC